MKATEVMALVDAINRDKEIDKGVILEAIEIAMAKAAAKKYGLDIEPHCKIDAESGDMKLYEVEVEYHDDTSYNEEIGEEEEIVREERHIQWDKELVVEHPNGEMGAVDPGDLGRVAAQTAKQVIIQRLREAERDVVFDEYFQRRREMVTGSVTRKEGPNLVVSLGKAEAFFPKWEQIPDEHYEVGERVRAIILDVKKQGQKVKIILSRTHPDFVARLFELEIPEIQEKVIEIKGLVREPGYRSKVAVSSIDTKIDCVGACVGVRGTRIKNITEELGGEKIDIIRWNEETEVLVMNALKPAQISSITLDYDHHKARVVVPDDQLSLAIGKKGQNVRLASRLTGWDIDIMTATSERRLMAQAVAKFETIPDVDRVTAERIFNAGYTSFDEILEAGPENLVETVDELAADRAAAICEWLFEIDEDEYLREVEVEMPEAFQPVTAREAAEALFANTGAAPEGEGGEGVPEGAEGEAATAEGEVGGEVTTATQKIRAEASPSSAAELFAGSGGGGSDDGSAVEEEASPADAELDEASAAALKGGGKSEDDSADAQAASAEEEKTEG